MPDYILDICEDIIMQITC